MSEVALKRALPKAGALSSQKKVRPSLLPEVSVSSLSTVKEVECKAQGFLAEGDTPV